MEDEIDLQKYVDVLRRQWKWIVGLALVSAVVALVVSFLLPPTYEAAALVVVARSSYQLQFDPRIGTVPETQQPYKAFPELALSDDLLMQVIAQQGDSLDAGDRDLAAFRERLAAQAGADPSLVRLAVTGADAHQAQAIVNAWAKLYTAYVSELYQQRSSDAVFFQQQVAEARAKLEAAEQALIDYQATNPINLVTARLTSRQTALADYLAAEQSITSIIQDARSLQQQLAQQNAGGVVTLADELSALYLQVDALSARTAQDPHAAVPIQLQVGGGGPLAGRTVAEQAALLDGLVNALRDKSLEIQQQVKALEPDILSLQEAQQAAQVKLDRLTRDRDVARDTYLALTRKLDEANVAAQDSSGVVRLASRAAVPTDPIAPRKGLNTILGGMLGLILGVVAAFAIDRRRLAAENAPVHVASARAG